MSSTKFYLDLRGKAKDGKGSLVIVLSHNRTTTTVATGVRISPEEWNGNAIVRNPNSQVLNVVINDLKNDIDKKLALLSLDPKSQRMTAPQVKKALMGKDAISEKRSSKLADLFREYMETDMKPGTRKIYDSALKKVIAFSGENEDINNVDLAWLHRFDKFMSQTQGANGKAIYLRCLRRICNYAVNNRLLDEYPFKGFSIKYEETRHRNASIEKLRELHDFKVEPRIQRFKDYFFLMFYLIGINAVDLCTAPKSAVVDGRFEYTRAKTGRQYSIKIEPEAMEIIRKYPGKVYLLDALDTHKDYKSFLKYMNKALKEIGPTTWEMIPDEDNLFAAPRLEKTVAPIIPNISSYYARHSWATIAHEIGLPIDTISQAMGHATDHKVTMIYINFDQEKVDEANRMVIDYFNQEL